MTKRRFIFGSEVKALFCDDEIHREIDPLGLAEIYTFWSTIAPQTSYKGVYEIPPGHYGVLHNGNLNLKPYWKISFGRTKAKSIEENCEDLRERIVKSVDLRFSRSDVPVGAYLSGGIDSSVISRIIKDRTNMQFETYSLRFSESEFDEGLYQNKMVQQLESKHHEICISNKEIGKIFPEVIKYTERPILRTAPAPLFLLSRLVNSSGTKVVVTGEGADEVLGGYDIFREAKVRRLMAENPKSKEINKYMLELYPWMKRSPRNSPAFSRSFFSKDLDSHDLFFSHRPRWSSTSILLEMLNRDFKAKLDDSDVINSLKEKLPNDFNHFSPLNKGQWLEYTTLLSGYILSAQGDRMLMAHSIEGRFPFLDPQVVDLSNTLDDDLKLNGLNEKYVLKKIFSRQIPESILRRPKQPYRSPDVQSFFFDDEKLDWIEEVTDENLLYEAGIFDPEIVKSVLRKCQNRKGLKMGNTDSMRVLAILSTMLCYRDLKNKEDRKEIILPNLQLEIDRT